MHYYMYEVKNTINDMIYVGIHKTKKLNDNYLGSGKIILQAIEKYGKDNFVKTILEYFEDEISMRNAEKLYVNEEFLKRTDVYNLALGGGSGWHYVNELGLNKVPKTDLYKANLSKCMLENYSESLREAIREAAKKPKSSEQKLKTSQKMTGRIHINNGIQSRMIHANEVIPDGFVIGRLKRITSHSTSSEVISLSS